MRLTTRPAAYEEVGALLQRAEAFAPSGLESAAEWCAGAHCFAVEQDGGKLVGAYALEAVRHAYGTEGVIVAAGGALPGVSLAASILPEAEARLIGCDVVKVQTMRRGLVKLLQARGYHVGGVLLYKRLKPCQ